MPKPWTMQALGPAMLVLDYNKCTVGVYMKDKLLHSYFIQRKQMNKWYMKLFHRLLNTSILNSIMI
jgi:hypothetical protein